MNLVVVGGVAAGATAAARARRVSETARITVFERGPYVSFANCGLPYFISGEISRRSDLLLFSPGAFRRRYRIDVATGTEVTRIDRGRKLVHVRDDSGERSIPYDKLILAQGSRRIVPDIPGADAPEAFGIATIPDMDRLEAFLSEREPRAAVVAGGGFVGLEMAEALVRRGLKTTLVEMLPTVMAGMDPEFGELIARELEAHGVHVVTGAAVAEFLPGNRAVRLSGGERLEADLLLFSAGVRPDLALAKDAGLALGPSGALQVDEFLRTSDPDIYAAGDMVEVVHRVSGRHVRLPLAGPANRQGRLAASNALGMALRYGGVLGTSVVKVFDAVAGMTGLTERGAREAGFDAGVAVVHKEHHAAYYPGARELALKLVYDRASTRLLGAQALGGEGVDKRIDVVATALAGKLTLSDLAELDLCYAPPFSAANDPLNVSAFVGLDDLTGFSPLVTAAELPGAEGAYVLDVRTPQEFQAGHLPGARNIPLDELRGRLDELPAEGRIVACCRSGHRSHVAVRLLRESGFGDVAHVTGGMISLEATSAVSRAPAGT